jgi:hypothetical protein
MTPMDNVDTFIDSKNKNQWTATIIPIRKTLIMDFISIGFKFFLNIRIGIRTTDAKSVRENTS